VRYRSAATQADRDYFLYLPRGYEAKSENTWPLLLILHGDGERGDARADLDYLFNNGPIYEAWIQRRALPFVIVAPQLPLYGREMTVPYLKERPRSEIPQRLPQGVPPRPKAFSTPPQLEGALAAELPSNETIEGPPDGWPKLEADVIAILDDVLRNYRVDPTRQYLTGISYGGFGTWYLASKYPDRFAAIAPVVGYGHPDLMEPIAKAKLPIWCFAGGADGAVPVKYFYAGLNRLKALGHSARFTIEADMNHDVWTRVYAGTDLYDWLLSHKKTTPPAKL
jgi:predicted peptidase